MSVTDDDRRKAEEWALLQRNCDCTKCRAKIADMERGYLVGLAAGRAERDAELATLREELADVKRGYDRLDANWDRLNNVNVGTFRAVLDMTDASIPEMAKVISDTKADRDRMREALNRIAVESSPLANKCPPIPHACPICEINFVAREALAATEGK